MGKNLKFIKHHNGENALGKNDYTMKMNAFGDMTDEEFKKIMVNFPMQTHKRGKGIWKRALSGLPKFVDWRKEGYVTPVRYQGNCGSCWAFAAAGAIEGQMYKKTGKLIPLSVQNLVDCSKPHGNNGCDWGNTYFAFRYVLHNGGVEAEATYRYKGKEGPCRYNPQNASAKIVSFMELLEFEDILMDVVAAEGPVAAAIDALHDSFKFYSEGIYYEPNCSQYNLSHAVLVVGYGYDGTETDGKKYWTIKSRRGPSAGHSKVWPRLPEFPQFTLPGIAAVAENYFPSAGSIQQQEDLDQVTFLRTSKDYQVIITPLALCATVDIRAASAPRDPDYCSH
ncbi:Cathepsin Q [Microtus ochrogaster]|uniref:Cathepsin Q n=1 Tax=Microtus ochrogaster TaxID=79684 RepID=A0A8J6G2N2_MICOH|nr:Cathepsin Q [Microtus ochrogaster]